MHTHLLNAAHWLRTLPHIRPFSFSPTPHSNSSILSSPCRLPLVIGVCRRAEGGGVPTDGADSLRWCERQPMTSRGALRERCEASTRPHSKHAHIRTHPGPVFTSAACAARLEWRAGWGEEWGHSQRIGTRCKQAEQGGGSSGEDAKERSRGRENKSEEGGVGGGDGWGRGGGDEETAS